MKGIQQKSKWYHKYLPFVAQSQESQVEWLVQALRKGTLADHEITPYVRLLLEAEEAEAKTRLAELVNRLGVETISKLLEVAEVYDAPKLFALLAAPTVEQAMIALAKTLPPYEKKPDLVMDRIFQAVHAKSPGLLEDAAALLRQRGAAPPGFEEAYTRFLEILEDERLLSMLYPKAKIEPEADIF